MKKPKLPRLFVLPARVTYDSGGRLAYQDLYSSGGTMQGSKGYTYDNADFVTQEAGSGSFQNQNTLFNRDANGNLISEVRTGLNPITRGYVYDGMNNRTQKNDGGNITNYTYNGLGRITSDGQNQFSYDANGNLVQRGTARFTYDWKNNMVHHVDTSNGTDMYHAYDIGNARLAKGRIEEVRESATQDLKKAQNTPMSPSSKRLPGVRTTTTLTTPRTFDEVGLNWIEFYHKSDNINLRTLNVSLWSNNYWELTDVMPLSLDSLFPYIGQINLDYADYENLPTGMNFYVTELDGTPSHSFDPAGNWTTSSNFDDFWVVINQSNASLHFVVNGTVETETLNHCGAGMLISEDHQICNVSAMDSTT